jgi:hypothetical protein
MIPPFGQSTPSQWLALPAIHEDDVRRGIRQNMFSAFVTERREIKPTEQVFSGTEQDRRDCDVHLVILSQLQGVVNVIHEADSVQHFMVIDGVA